MKPFEIAVLGAPCTGKSQLALALAAHLRSTGLTVHVATQGAPAPCSTTNAVVITDTVHPTQFALDKTGRVDVALLMGLDVPIKAEHLPKNVHHTRTSLDQLWRDRLVARAQPYQVVYGVGEERLRNALFALANQAPQWMRHLERPETFARWRGPCDTCGDGNCEHRLFTGLLEKKKPSVQ